MKKILFLAGVFFLSSVKAQLIRTSIHRVYTKLTAYSNQFGDAFSFAANQGALAADQKFSAGVYSERKFFLTALSTYSAAFVLPASSGNFGVRGDYSGQQAFNEAMLGMAYAKKLGSKAAVGVQFNYLSMKTAGYGKASAINFEAGAIFHLTAQLNAGLQVYNPIGSTWGKNKNEKLPSIYTAGFGYDASQQVFIGFEVEKVENSPVNINAGIQYKPAEKLLAKAGLHTATSVYFFGLGVQLKALRFDATASVHPYLGLTPGLLLLYSPKE